MGDFCSTMENMSMKLPGNLERSLQIVAFSAPIEKKPTLAV